MNTYLLKLLRKNIHKLISESYEGGNSTALYGGSNYIGIQPEYHQDLQNKDSDFPEWSLQLQARKNLEDIKKQNANQSNDQNLENKALEDFCF